MSDEQEESVMLKIGDIIETTRPMSDENWYQRGQHLQAKLLTPESVAHAETLIAVGRWRKVKEESNETKPTATN